MINPVGLIRPTASTFKADLFFISTLSLNAELIQQMLVSFEAVKEREATPLLPLRLVTVSDKMPIITFETRKKISFSQSRDQNKNFLVFKPDAHWGRCKRRQRIGEDTEECCGFPSLKENLILQDKIKKRV